MIVTTIQNFTHIGFGDESNWNNGRFRSIGLVTSRLTDLSDLEKEYEKVLQNSNISELQWKKLNGADKREAAKKVCELILSEARKHRIRVDVVIWDIQDSRHNVRGRDDIANLQRMYYHLFRNVMRKRWPNDGIWCLCPDKHTTIDWMTIHACLDNVGTSVDSSLCANGGFKLQLRREFNIEAICPTTSDEHPPMLQIADLFAGMAVFSREKFQKYMEWEISSNGQTRLFQFTETEDSTVDQCTKNLSRKDNERFKVIKNLKKICDNSKMGVSINKNEGLWTPNPENPINFWFYKPQHPNDKAPLRVQ